MLALAGRRSALAALAAWRTPEYRRKTMAISACARCQNQSFELQEATVSGANRKLVFVQCAGCGAPVGVVESHALLRYQEQDARMKNLEHQLASIAGSLSHIGRIVGALANQRTI
jgi:endonuclease/exonuclease/phosphatase (EEP) superfamily protein YafD